MTGASAATGSSSLSRDGDFRRLWAGQAISEFGTAVSTVALPVVAVLVLHASTVQAALLIACSSLPHAILALPAGAWIDRIRKRPIMIGADIGRAVLLASVPATAAMGRLTLAQLYAVVLVGALLQLLFQVANQAHLPALIAGEHLLAANSRTSATGWVAVISGPAAAGAVIAVAGPTRTLLIDAASFLLSAAAIARLRRPEPAPHRPADRHLWSEIGEGLRYLRGHHALRRILAANVILSWTIMFVAPVETLFLLRTLHASPTQYGLVLAVPGLGGLLGSLTARRLINRHGTATTMWWTGLLRGPGVLLAALAPPSTAGLITVGIGWTTLLTAASIYNIAQNTYRQQTCPAHLHARVYAAWTWAVRIGQPATPLLGGVLATAIGLRPTIVVAGILLATATLVLDRPHTTDTTHGS